MNWKILFRNYILERGRRYYEQNKVQNISHTNGIYRAKVVGEVPYHVEAKVAGSDVVYMKCSCPYAASGKYCKHMAALMFAIEEQDSAIRLGALKFQKAQQQEQDFQKKDKEYRYFDLAKITADRNISSSVYTAAKKLIQEKKVELDHFYTGYRESGSDEHLLGFARGHYMDGRYLKNITVRFERDKMVHATCDVLGCRGGYEPYYYWMKQDLCEHIVALLFLVDDYLKKYNPGDSTDANGAVLFREFRELHKKAILESTVKSENDVVLEPVLESAGNHLRAGFKIGNEKLYVVKNLTDLVGEYENQGSLPLGSKAKLDFAKHRMDKASELLYQFVRDIVQEEQERFYHLNAFTNHYVEEEEVKNRIELYGERLDKFYELVKGKVITCNDKQGRNRGKRSLEVKSGKPNIHIQVQKDEDNDGTFHGVYVSGKIPEMIRGGRSQYFMTDNAFCRLDEKTEKEIAPLLDMEQDGEISFYAGRKHLSEFYYQVLPILKQNATVEEISPESIKPYIPPEAVYAFYLDAENGNVMCKAKVRYGENEVSLLDSLRTNYSYEMFRNLNQERDILQHVRDLFPEVSLERDELHCGESEDAVFQVMESGVERLMALGEVHTTDRFRSRNIRPRPKLKVGVSIESDIMNLSVTSDDIEQQELLEILQSYQRKKKYYRLKNGDFIAVNEADMEMLSQMMESLHLSPKEFVKGNMKVPIYRALYLNKMLEQGENVYLNRDTHFKNLIKEFKTVEDSEFEVPESLSSIMRNYQLHGFKWMKTLEYYGFGGILADDMGLGKTLQMISLLLSAKENKKLDTALIVAPASLVYNWKEEFARFAPELQVNLVVGNQEERAEIIKNCKECDVLVTSYDLLKRDIAEYEGITFTYQVIDEAQYIKNHGTAAAKSVKIIRSQHRYALTGTPIENRLSELWSIFDYLMPGFLYGYEVFRKELETPIVKGKDEKASEKLKKMVSPFILRRLKGDVLKDLPDKMEEIRYAKLEAKQQQLYEGQVIHMKEMIAMQDADDFQKNKLQILAELTKIRQICCDPELLFERYQGGSAKREACIDLIKSAIEGEHKILLFSQFTSMLELMEHDLKEEGIAYYKITGATPKEKRVEMVSLFNSDQTPVFLISLKAGGTGLNLTGADVVIHYDPWWNQAVQNQATDRAHRIGQTKVVSVYKLIAKDTIEEKIVKMQEDKRDLADSILSGETGGITKMSKDELLELLTD